MSAGGAVFQWSFSYSDRTHPCFDTMSGWKVLTVKVSAPASLKGRSILFFSDLHLKAGNTFSLTLSSLRSWKGHHSFASHISRLIQRYHVDTLMFGGDTIRETCLVPDFFSQLKTLPDDIVKIAVPGNWDRRYPWLPESYWRKQYADAEFHFLRNESFSDRGIHFIGLDDIKDGNPFWSNSFLSEDEFNFLIIHNPDTIRLIPHDDLARIPMITAGHTHGGQIRIPFFGAVKTSTKNYNLQRGFYKNKQTNTHLYISAGIGTTWYPLRVFCPPEIYIFEFI